MFDKIGRHFLQIPGPTNVPNRILQAISRPTIDHRGPEFKQISKEVLIGLRRIFKTENPVLIFPTSRTGSWEAALVNTIEPGDKILMFETGHFAIMWKQMAENLGINVDFVPGDWRTGVDPKIVEERLIKDQAQEIKAVAVVHNETSTGVTSQISEIRSAINRANHSTLLMVDTISSLGSMDYCHDEWRVDVTICCSQKGLMLPPGLGFNVISEKALDRSISCTTKRHFWSWSDMLKANSNFFYPSTPGTNLLFGLREAISMLEEEGLDNVFKRHQCFAEATRLAVRSWGLEILSIIPSENSNSLTAVLVPDDHSADKLRDVILKRFNMSLGNGLGKVADKVFRIGHLGDLNDLSLVGTLAGIEMGLEIASIPHSKGGITVAMDHLLKNKLVSS